MKTVKRSLPREIFLSHSSKDRHFAESVARLLKDHGIRVWYSPTKIVGGKQWHDKIGAALKRCDWFIVILSPNSVKSKWVKNEYLYALNNSRYNERLIPVLYKPCEHERLSWTLSAIQFVDFKDDFNEGCRNLLRIWKLRYKRKREPSQHRLR